MIKKSDKKFFKKAEQLAEISDFARTRVGCVAVCQGRIIGMGFNANKTHPLQKRYNIYRKEGFDENNETNVSGSHKIHAEIMCLNSMKDMNLQFNHVRFYIYRKRKDIGHGISRPCPACMAALKDLGVKHIYYTTNDGYAYEDIS